MMYAIQIRSWTGEWQDVRPVGALVGYRFLTREAAERMARICFPEQMYFDTGQVRVTEVPTTVIQGGAQ
jgi:hypothetical protein